MTTFFLISNILFDRIKEFFFTLFSIVSSLTSIVAFLLIMVITISFISKGINKKRFNDNRKIILLSIIFEIISCISASNILIVKFNILILSACLIMLLYKGVASKKKTTRKNLTNKNKVEKKEEDVKDEVI